MAGGGASFWGGFFKGLGNSMQSLLDRQHQSRELEANRQLDRDLAEMDAEAQRNEVQARSAQSQGKILKEQLARKKEEAKYLRDRANSETDPSKQALFAARADRAEDEYLALLGNQDALESLMGGGPGGGEDTSSEEGQNKGGGYLRSLLEGHQGTGEYLGFPSADPIGGLFALSPHNMGKTVMGNLTGASDSIANSGIVEDLRRIFSQWGGGDQPIEGFIPYGEGAEDLPGADSPMKFLGLPEQEKDFLGEVIRRTMNSGQDYGIGDLIDVQRRKDLRDQESIKRRGR